MKKGNLYLRTILSTLAAALGLAVPAMADDDDLPEVERDTVLLSPLHFEKDGAAVTDETQNQYLWNELMKYKLWGTDSVIFNKEFFRIAEPSGYHNIISSAEKAFASGSSSFTFKTPVECGYILVGFFATADTSIAFSNIMLAKGTTARPFRPLTADTLNTVQLGDTILQFSTNGFDEAVINCEREDFELDGYSNNMAASILDQYGNLAVDFLRLVKGDNAVAVSGDIDSVMIDPRFWEL